MGVVGVAVAALIAPTGCTFSQGQLLYMLGFGSGQTIEARFRLTDRPLLVFVDDIHERLTWPAAEGYLFGALTEELLRHQAATKIIPLETITRLRQTEPDFQRRGCREIGEMTGADQVLWVEVLDYLGDPQIQTANDAAYLRVSVKVLNARETEHRTRVRLWPESPEGQHVSVTMGGAEAVESDTEDAIAKKLADRLAVEAAKLFYDHRLGDFERAP
jgi:hypothetical protein